MSNELLDLISDHFYKFPIKDRTRLRPEIEKRAQPEAHRLMNVAQELSYLHPSLKEGFTRLWNAQCAELTDYIRSDAIMKEFLLPEIKRIKPEMRGEDLLTLLMFLCFDYPQYCWEGMMVYLIYKNPAYEDLVLPQIKERSVFMRHTFYKALSNILSREFCSNDLHNINKIMKAVHGKWNIPYPTAYLILKEVFPHAVCYDCQEKISIDPEDSPGEISDNFPTEESVRNLINHCLAYGSINFFEHGFMNTHDIISEMRRMSYINESSEKKKAVSFSIPEDHMKQLKMHLNPKTSVMVWIESGGMESRSLIEYGDTIYMLYEMDQVNGPDGYPLLFGWPITRKKEELSKRFVYECEDMNPIQIVPVYL